MKSGLYDSALWLHRLDTRVERSLFPCALDRRVDTLALGKFSKSPRQRLPSLGKYGPDIQSCSECMHRVRTANRRADCQKV